MDQQLRIADFYMSKSPESDTLTESHSMLTREEGALVDYELHLEASSELSEAATLEQRRAHKIEFQVRYCPT